MNAKSSLGVLAVICAIIFACGQNKPENNASEPPRKDLNQLTQFVEQCWPSEEEGCPPLVAGLSEEEFPDDIPNTCVFQYFDCLPDGTEFDSVIYFKKPDIYEDVTETDAQFYKPGPEGEGETKCEKPQTKKSGRGKAKSNCTNTCLDYEVKIDADCGIEFEWINDCTREIRNECRVSFKWYF
jgi:hypothetical protein